MLLATVLSCTTIGTTGELSQAAIKKAYKCSLTHAVDFAEFTNETADAIADTAYAKCANEWYVFEEAIRAETLSEMQDQFKNFKTNELQSFTSPTTINSKLSLKIIREQVMNWRVLAAKNGAEVYAQARQEITSKYSTP